MPPASQSQTAALPQTHPLFPNLLSPIRIRNTVIRNRVLVTGHQPRLNDSGMIGDRLYYYHLERAKGGIGLMIMEETGVALRPGTSLEGKLFLVNISDEIIPQYRRVADGVHRYGAKILAQLIYWPHHTGLCCSDGIRLAAHNLRAATIDDIKRLVRQYAEAARRAQAGGLDGVEVTTWGGLLAQFVSPDINRRTDAYGGSFANRIRIVVEVLEAVREAAGDELVVGVRVDGESYTEGGTTPDLAARVVATLEERCLIDYANVVAGGGPGLCAGLNEMSMFVPLGAHIGIAARVKRECDVPVLHAGRITDPNLAETFLEKGYVDMIGMTRAHIADPHLVNKAAEGRLDEITTCVGCNEGCIGRHARNLAITCVQNPVTGREEEWARIVPAQVAKRVVVVGGGMAGLKVASVAAQRGHDVTLVELQPEVGGQVRIASKVPARAELGDMVRNVVRACERAGVQILTGTRATADTVLGPHPDAVVVATGSGPAAPGFSGAQLPHVYDCFQFLDDDVSVKPGGRVIVYDLIGDEVAASIADMLARQGASVEMLTTHPYFGWEVVNRTWGILHYRLLQVGVKMEPDTALVCIQDHSAVVQHMYWPETETRHDVEAVIASLGRRPNADLADALQGRVPQIHKVGHADSLSDLHGTMLGAETLGRAL